MGMHISNDVLPRLFALLEWVDFFTMACFAAIGTRDFCETFERLSSVFGAFLLGISPFVWLRFGCTVRDKETRIQEQERRCVRSVMCTEYKERLEIASIRRKRFVAKVNSIKRHGRFVYLCVPPTEKYF